MSDPYLPESAENDVALSPEDAAVLDAVLGARAAGSDTGPMPAGSAERAGKVRGVLALLDAVPSESADDDGEALVQATLARVAAQREADRPVEVTPLCEDDGRALDAVLANGGQPGPRPAGLGERPERVAEVLSLLGQLVHNETADRDERADEDLVQRTVTAADEARQRERFAQQIEMFAQPPRTFGVGLRQIVAAAAVFLLGISVLMPTIDRQRQAQQQAACSYNLSIAGRQINQYALDHAGMLPRGPVGESWIKTGQPDAVDADGRYQSNSAHLYILIREAYVAPSRLACASNDRAVASMPGSGQRDWASPQAISYSYQNQHGVAPIRVDLSSPRLAVLADKNPLFVVRNGKVVHDRNVKRDATTTLHDGKGQNVLTLDGGVSWTVAPRIGDDNIWQIRGYAGGYVGNEVPADTYRDSFLVP
ncbi:MAG: hypothetical protein AAGH99_03515 [Planctomycetota bacterium]